MPRQTAFVTPGRGEPFAHDEGIRPDHASIRSPLSFFNPTRARFNVERKPRHPRRAAKKRPPVPEVAVPLATINWRSRDNRKGRHALRVHRTHPAVTATFRAVLQGLKRMCTQCPYGDVSYDIAVLFAVGSLVFILSGLFSWLPIVAPSSAFPNEQIVGGGATGFVGATLFEIGGVLLVFEASNEHRTGCFGWALHELLSKEAEEGEGEDQALEEALENPGVLARADVKHCEHHHQRAHRKRRSDEEKEEHPVQKQQWVWFPSWYELKTHYVHEIGFMASITMAIGATVFYISGICALPGILENMSLGLAQGLYWFTYLLGGVLFIIASALYMLENQITWYTPAPHLLGWHIGLWNLIGSIGWTLAAAWGYCTRSGCVYQSELTLLWASVAFLIGSMLQWYEALDKYPVERE